MEPTQTDFYKGIFIQEMLRSTAGFTMQALTSDTVPQYNGLPYSDFLAQLNDQADIFAAAFVPQTP